MPNRILIGSSPGFRAVLDDVSRVAPFNSTVLLQGETGTGKELIARAIHDASERRNRPFVAVNCAAIPASLLESELFGHERGAFTGASAQTVGRFQAAEGGTLFLDEIGELPLELQPKLLRVLQEKEFERVGSNRTLRVDVRIVAATNQDLWDMVEEGDFRADLYYRLNVYPVTIPPLRHRREDIPALVRHYVRHFAERHSRSIREIPDDLLMTMTGYRWPGNIRELQNFVERSVILTSGTVLHSLAHLLSTRRDPPIPTLADAERLQIVAALHEANWVVGGSNGAAHRLGLKRTTLLSRMKKLGISRPGLNGSQPAAMPQGGTGTDCVEDTGEPADINAVLAFSEFRSRFAAGPNFTVPHRMPVLVS
jgi:formate hydrogenlyase transcriptional activator